MKPKVTVLMPVYNGAKYLREAIQSILAQTFVYFEFLIIDDGSNDQSVNIIRDYRDFRIRLERNEGNQGLVATLNRGIDLARGGFIARMDCDDISVPERLAKQVAFMEQHPEIGVCGGWIEYMDNGFIIKCPADHESICSGLRRGNQLAHPSVIIRKDILRNHQLYYDPAYIHAEDYELWTRMAKITRLANIPEILVRYRRHPAQIGSKYQAEQQSVVNIIQQKLN